MVGLVVGEDADQGVVTNAPFENVCGMIKRDVFDLTFANYLDIWMFGVWNTDVWLWDKTTYGEKKNIKL